MNAQQALDLIAQLPGKHVKELWQAGRPLPGNELRAGLWLGRNSGMARPIKWFVRRIIGRDYFAKLIFEDFGVNVRVAQDGSHSLLPNPKTGEGLKLDLPFALASAGLDYGIHYLGIDTAQLQMRDILRVLDFSAVTEVVPAEQLERIGVEVGKADDGELVISYIAPLGISAMKGTPFGMVWWRETTPEEEAQAVELVGSRRFFDSSVPPARDDTTS